MTKKLKTEEFIVAVKKPRLKGNISNAFNRESDPLVRATEKVAERISALPVKERVQVIDKLDMVGLLVVECSEAAARKIGELSGVKYVERTPKRGLAAVKRRL